MTIDTDVSFIIPQEAIQSHTRDDIRAFLEQAKSQARAPISQFHVGAVAVGASGQAYLGTNLEFTSQPLSQTVHAEQFAVCLARMCGESELTHMYVSEIPCGHCRQFLLELGQPEMPISVMQGDTWLDSTLKELLPYPFTLSSHRHSALTTSVAYLKLDPHNKRHDDLVSHALEVTSRAYVPYTKNWSGVVIRMEDDELYMGNTIESAAYNPTLHALQAGLIHLVSEGREYHEIREVIFMEREDSGHSASTNVWNLVKSLSPLSQIEYITVLPQEL